MNTWRTLSTILDRITNQILEELHTMRLLTVNGGEMITGDNRPALVDRSLEILSHLLKDRIEINQLVRIPSVCTHLSKGEQVLEHFAHPFRPFRNEIHTHECLAVDLSTVALKEELGIVRDH